MHSGFAVVHKYVIICPLTTCVNHNKNMVRKNNFIDIIISDVIMDLGSLMELTVHSSDGGVASIMEMVSSGGECLLSKYSFHER